MKRLSDSSLRLIYRRRFQSLNQKPKTHDQLEQSHRCIEDVVVNDLVEVGENEINECAEDAPGRTDHAEDCQSARDVFRFEPEPGANGRSQTKERQTYVIIIETCGDLYARERLKAFRFENFEIRRVAEEPKRSQTVQRSDEPQDREDDAKECARQCKSAIYGREYDVERSCENDRADVISDEACERGAKLRLMRENVARGICGVAWYDERAEQNVIAEHNQHECEQPGDSCD